MNGKKVQGVDPEPLRAPPRESVLVILRPAASPQTCGELIAAGLGDRNGVGVGRIGDQLDRCPVTRPQYPSRVPGPAVDDAGRRIDFVPFHVGSGGAVGVCLCLAAGTGSDLAHPHVEFR